MICIMNFFSFRSSFLFNTTLILLIWLITLNTYIHKRFTWMRYRICTELNMIIFNYLISQQISKCMIFMRKTVCCIEFIWFLICTTCPFDLKFWHFLEFIRVSCSYWNLSSFSSKTFHILILKSVNIHLYYFI